MSTSELLRRRFQCDRFAPQLAREALRDLDVIAAVHEDAALMSFGQRPALRRRSSEPGGLGLHVVAALAETWGAEAANGRRVWAELPL